MAAPRRLPSADEILRLRRAHWTTAKIADEYGVTPAAVSAALGREGKSEDRRRYPDLIPWRVKSEHQGDYALRMLRWEGRRRNGELAKHNLKQLTSWKAALRREGVVIDYDPQRGFVKVPRQMSDDEDALVRRPSPPESGTELVHGLARLAEMRRSGLLTADEFAAAKRKMLA